MRILMADDNAEMRRIIRRFIGGLSTEIFECGDGLTAFDLYRRLRPDWVLLDWKMNPLDGIEATRLILADDHAARVCIVTSFDDPDLRREAMGVGAEAFVAKHDLRLLRTVLTAAQPVR